MTTPGAPIEASTAPGPGRLAELVWRRIPDVVGRLSPTARIALRDGDYLLAWPKYAGIVPGASVVLGLLMGAIHAGAAFSSSIVVLLIYCLAAGLGSAYGVWLLVGYAIADLIRAAIASPYAVGSVVLGRLISYVVLLGLIVVVPLLAMSVRNQLHRKLGAGRARTIGSFVAAGATAGVATFLWGQSAAFFVRPVWSLAGESPDVPSIAPLQLWGPLLGAVVALGFAVRAWLTITAPSADRGPLRVRYVREWGVPWPLRAVLQSLVFTALFAGLVGSVLEALVVFVVFFGLNALRLAIIPRLTSYARLVDRIPRLVRILVCCVVAYLAALAITEPAASRGESSFLPLLAAGLPALVIASLLLPERARSAER